MLARKISNVGFEAIELEDRRPVGIEELVRYPIFPEGLRDFLRRAIPEARHDELVWSVALTARKPATPGGGTHGG